MYYTHKSFYIISIKSVSFKFKPLESINNFKTLLRSIEYKDYAEELCPNDSCNEQGYELVIDDLDDGCNNFSIYTDTNPCDNNYDYDSLVYQISNGIETYSSNIDLSEFISHNSLSSIIENNTVFASDAKVYPNPAYSYINLEYTSDSSTNVEVEIYDRAMKLVRKLPWDVSRGITRNVLDISDLHDGLYIIRFNENDKSIYKKFIVINN